MLAQVWQALGGDPALLELVSAHGNPRLPGPLPVGELAMGAVAAQLLAAEELRAAGRPLARVVLDAVHIGLAFRSERFLTVDGVAAGPGFAALSRFLPTADGWVRLHANYPQHDAAVHRALGPDPAAAAAGRSAQDVEDAVVAAGGVAAKVRTAQGWATHPQGVAVRDLPILALRQIAPGPPQARTLHGLRVLDLTRVIAGPVGTRTLASYGADVLRVDSPRSPEDPSTLLETGPGKRYVRLDLAEPVDRTTFEGLLAAADVLVQGYRPGALDAYGLHPNELADRRPGLVMVTLSAWGAAGPWARRRGFDSIVQAATGIADETRDSGGTPGVLPAQALDHAAGHLVAAIVLRALTQARQEGGAWHGELSLAQLAAWLLAASRSPAAPEPTGPTGPIAPIDPAPYLMNLSSSAGTLTLVRPPGSPDWLRGPVQVAADEARWAAREIVQVSSARPVTGRRSRR